MEYKFCSPNETHYLLSMLSNIFSSECSKVQKQGKKLLAHGVAGFLRLEWKNLDTFGVSEALDFYWKFSIF